MAVSPHKILSVLCIIDRGFMVKTLVTKTDVQILVQNCISETNFDFETQTMDI